MKRPHIRARFATAYAVACFPGFAHHWGWSDVFDYWAIHRHPGARGASKARLALEYLTEKTFPVIPDRE
jgi:hypothetical protein